MTTSESAFPLKAETNVYAIPEKRALSNAASIAVGAERNPGPHTIHAPKKESASAAHCIFGMRSRRSKAERRVTKMGESLFRIFASAMRA